VTVGRRAVLTQRRRPAAGAGEAMDLAGPRLCRDVDGAPRDDLGSEQLFESREVARPGGVDEGEQEALAFRGADVMARFAHEMKAGAGHDLPCVRLAAY
jgi:hypothetical protein